IGQEEKIEGAAHAFGICASFAHNPGSSTHQLYLGCLLCCHQWQRLLVRNPTHRGPRQTIAHLRSDASRRSSSRVEAPSWAGSNSRVGIFLRSGLHFQARLLVLTPADSNLVVAGYGMEVPIISGARRITAGSL